MSVSRGRGMFNLSFINLFHMIFNKSCALAYAMNYALDTTYLSKELNNRGVKA